MNTLNNASNYNIVGIQLKLFDSNNFEKELQKRTYSKKPIKTDKRVIIIKTDFYEYINPICSVCGLKSIVKQENRKRIVNFSEKHKHQIFLKKYSCKDGNHNFQTELSFLEKNKNYVSHFKEVATETLKSGYISLRKQKKKL